MGRCLDAAPLFAMRYEAGDTGPDGEDLEGLLDEFPEWINNPNDRARWRELSLAGRWFVYAAFPVWGATSPIYVGMTNNLERRLLQHQRARWWWQEVDHFIVTRCETKQAAAADEKRYIQKSSPCYNTMHYREGK